ncbi:MAG: carboxypeptidase regulatory-like domain-containing protein [Chloracidobacterium sp.]|nr:carboxypeptidase regulatory-like domain-containing protein [Chloracidobacterium sp.]
MSKVNCALLLFTLIIAPHVNSAAQSTVKSDNRRTGTVSGQVTLNGEPLGDVTIQLFPDRMSISGDPRSPAKTITDEQGNYRFTGLAAGSYQVSVLSDKFIITGDHQSNPQEKMVSVLEGEHVERFNLALKPGGVITGRVTDSNGLPLSRQVVELIRIDADGKTQPYPFTSRFTDHEGVYRIPRVPDGRYLVSSGVSQSGRMGTPISGDVYYPQTFHPGVSDPSQARAVEISEGAEINGIDILIAEVKKSFDLKGRVVNAETGAPVEGIEIFYSLHRAESGVLGPRSSRGVKSNSEGEFIFQGLSPGKYDIYPLVGTSEYFTDPALCEITDGGIDGVEVKLRQGSSISGTVILEGTNDPAVLESLSHVSISGYSKNQQGLILPRNGARINTDGSYRIVGLRPGSIHFALAGDTKAFSFAIKRIERNGTPIQDGVEIGPEENLSNVRVIVGHGNLTVGGEVKVISGNLPPQIGIYVNLFRLSESESGPPLGAFVDARGQFMYQNLIPAEYEVRLVPIVRQSREPLDKSLLRLIHNTRQKVLIGGADGPNSQTKVTLVIDLSQKESDN